MLAKLIDARLPHGGGGTGPLRQLSRGRNLAGGRFESQNASLSRGNQDAAAGEHRPQRFVTQQLSPYHFPRRPANARELMPPAIDYDRVATSLARNRQGHGPC